MAPLTQALHDLVTLLESDRDGGRRRRAAGLVAQLATPDAGFLRPELERLLVRYTDAGDTVARDQIARVLSVAAGAAALPALLRALVDDRNDDGETLQLDVLRLFSASRIDALAGVMTCVAADDPGLRRVGIWGLSVLDWTQRDEYIALVVDASSDVDARVRAEAVDALGSVFGGDHPAALDAVLAAFEDADPAVRRSAVMALCAWRDDAATDRLVAGADDSDARVRAGVAWLVTNRPGPAVQTALERLAADDDSEPPRTTP
ncbi:HEAT repeat domain-containing protein [Asanoa sp. NPDC050611]|uniref:HEAT repeat domain-containing protein n=1 Tax=Asanoa sp. NPDC050611 TaxID=3157098 RepID=UPI0033EF3E41